MTQETIVRLKVISTELVPELVSAAIGISCDRCWRIGDLRPKTIIKEKQNGWILDSGLPRTATLDEHINALLSILEPRADSVRQLSVASTVELSCVVYSDHNPGLSFDASVIAKIARLGAGLDIDLYIMKADVAG